MQWGPETDAKLFMHVMAIGKVKLDYQALATAMGNDCTPKAIMHRMAKLRAQAAEQNTAASASSPSLDPPNAGKRDPRTPGLSAPTSVATTSPASTTGNTKNAAITTVSTTGVNKITPAKKGNVGAASAGSKRTAVGKAKAIKGSPLKVEMTEDKDEWEDKVEVETPSKKLKVGGLGAKGGRGNLGLNANFTARADQNA